MIKQVLSQIKILFFIIVAGGYENLTFEEKDHRSYLEKARRLRVGMGDAETIPNYLLKCTKESSMSWTLTRTADYKMRFDGC